MAHFENNPAFPSALYASIQANPSSFLLGKLASNNDILDLFLESWPEKGNKVLHSFWHGLVVWRLFDIEFISTF